MHRETVGDHCHERCLHAADAIVRSVGAEADIAEHGRIEDGRPFLCEGKSGPVSFRLLHVFDLRDGKIAREQVWCDLAAIQQQLGCAPA